MTISIENNRDVYDASGSTYTCTFKLFREEDLTVAFVDGATNAVSYYTNNIDYTISDNVVSFTETTPSGGKVVLWGTYDNKQDIDYVQLDSFLMSVHEDSIDKLTMLTQRNHDNIQRIPKFRGSVTATIPEPMATDLVGWSLTVSGTTVVSGALGNYTNPIADARLTEASAVSAATSASEAAVYRRVASDWSALAKENADKSNIQVYEVEADGTTQDGKDVFIMPWSFDGETSTLSVYQDGARISPSDYTIDVTNTVLMENNVPIGTAMLFVAKEYDSGYNDVDYFPTPASDLSNAYDMLWVKATDDIYEFVGFEHKGFDVGTKCWFNKNVAPLGWNIVSVADCVLGVKNLLAGTYNVAGGRTAGNWYIPVFNGVPSHYHGTGGVPLADNQMAAHTHTMTIGGTGAHDHTTTTTIQVGTGGADGSYGNTLIGNDYTSRAAVLFDRGGSHSHTVTIPINGSGQSHTHGITDSTALSIGGAESSGAWRPTAIVGIIASKSASSSYSGGGGSVVPVAAWVDVTSDAYWQSQYVFEGSNPVSTWNGSAWVASYLGMYDINNYSVALQVREGTTWADGLAPTQARITFTREGETYSTTMKFRSSLGSDLAAVEWSTATSPTTMDFLPGDIYTFSTGSNRSGVTVSKIELYLTDTVSEWYDITDNTFWKGGGGGTYATWTEGGEWSSIVFGGAQSFLALEVLNETVMFPYRPTDIRVEFSGVSALSIRVTNVVATAANVIAGDASATYDDYTITSGEILTCNFSEVVNSLGVPRVLPGTYPTQIVKLECRADGIAPFAITGIYARPAPDVPEEEPT